VHEHANASDESIDSRLTIILEGVIYEVLVANKHVEHLRNNFLLNDASVLEASFQHIWLM